MIQKKEKPRFPGSRVIDEQYRPSPAIPPKTVQLTAVIAEYDEKNRSCRIKIKEITAYGAGTPNLATGEEITAELVESAFDEEKMTALIENGTPVRLGLRYNYARKIGQQKSDAWTITKVE